MTDKTDDRAKEAGAEVSVSASRRSSVVLAFSLLVALLGGVLILNAGMGAVPISPGTVFAILLERIGFDIGIEATEQQVAVLSSIRLPRVFLGLLIGAALAVAGAGLQAVFRNPLADPAIIGVSGGAAVGAIAMIVIGLDALGRVALPLAAFAGGLIATMIVYQTARRGGRTEVVTLILAGIAVNAIAGAATGLMINVADDDQLRTIVFWSMGTLGGGTWRVVSVTALFVIPFVFLMARRAGALNVLLLGEEEAYHIGVDTERLRITVVVFAALLTGATVAAAGIIGFVGLLAPHLVRLTIGPDNRTLIPASALVGAILVLLADLVARTTIAPAELPLGVITALVGGPFFLWLLRRTRRARGGWG